MYLNKTMVQILTSYYIKGNATLEELSIKHDIDLVILTEFVNDVVQQIKKGTFDIYGFS